MVSRKPLLLGIALLLFLGGLATYILIPGRAAPIAPDPLEVAANDPARDDPAPRLVIRQHCLNPVLLMNWVLEERRDQKWQRVTGKTFPGGYLINKEFSFNITRPPGTAACRVRIQYGIGLYGARLWRERARVAWRTGRLASALRYNEWEACESTADLK